MDHRLAVQRVVGFGGANLLHAQAVVSIKRRTQRSN